MNRKSKLSAAIALAVGLASTACNEAPAGPGVAPPDPRFGASSETLIRDRFPLVNTVFNACTGEWVDIEGEFLVVVRQVLAPSGRTNFLAHVNVHVKGSGQTTGTGYVSNEQLNLVANGGDAGAQVFVLEFRILTVSQGPSDNAAGRIRIHMTVNANGDVTVDNFEFVFDECRG